MKTYVITLSQSFLKDHPRAGEPTFFAKKFMNGVFRTGYYSAPGEIETMGIPPILSKIHTIRGNYDLWTGRIKEVQNGEAVLSIRVWSGKPYNSGQITIATLTAEHGVGIQEIRFAPTSHYADRRDLNPLGTWSAGHKYTSDFGLLAQNDGLAEQDFRDWFRGYDLSSPMAIIQFTNFRY